jgi:hypothetical protein
VLAVATIVVCMIGVFVPKAQLTAGLAIVAALVMNLLIIRPTPLQHFLADSGVLFANQEIFGRLRNRMSVGERAYIVPATPQDFTSMPKSGTLFQIPVINDLEPQPSRRYTDFYVTLRRGSPLGSLNDVYVPGLTGGFLGKRSSRRLLDVSAARYIVVRASADSTGEVAGVPLRMVDNTADVRVYENVEALPRAFYVPRVETVSDSQELLRRLAFGADDLRRVALIEGELESRFRGVPGNSQGGSVEFITNEPEHVALRVQAPARGFLFLADQHYPGWEATVNGLRTGIARANYTFRLVEVPTGDSIVEFRYHPRSVGIGLVASAAALLCAALLLFWTKRPGSAAFAKQTANTGLGPP